jgi:hypothetical protein
MTASSRRTILSAIAGFAATLRDARAGPYPDRPVTLVVPFALVAQLTFWRGSWPNVCTEHLGSR